MNALKVPAKWEDDCQGKKDYDGELVKLSTRYWPQGGGFHVLDATGWKGNETRPEIRASANASIYLGSTANDFYRDAKLLIEREFEGDSEAEVKAAVEAWALEQFARIDAALRREFGVPSEGQMP